MACQKGHLEIVEKLLEQSAIEVNQATTDIGATPLFIACENGHLEIVEKLLEQPGIEVNKASKGYNPPLVVACEYGHLEIVHKLLEHPHTALNKYRELAINAASFKGHNAIVKFIRGHCPQTQFETNSSFTSATSFSFGNTIRNEIRYDVSTNTMYPQVRDLLKPLESTLENTSGQQFSSFTFGTVPRFSFKVPSSSFTFESSQSFSFEKPSSSFTFGNEDSHSSKDSAASTTMPSFSFGSTPSFSFGQTTSSTNQRENGKNEDTVNRTVAQLSSSCEIAPPKSE